jgi:3-methyladenine DNA glycosylase/8-oxoguanine DNA glycosylase
MAAAPSGCSKRVRTFVTLTPCWPRLIVDRPGFDPRAWMARLPPMDLYGALLFQVTGQQLSVSASRRILVRIQALFGGHLPTPAELSAVDPSSSAKRGSLGGRSARCVSSPSG